MEWHLRNCCRWTLVVVYSLLLCLVLTSTAAADSLQPSNSHRSSLLASRDSVDKRSSLGVDSLQPNYDRSPLWELPIVTAPACDLSTSEGSGTRVDDVTDNANADAGLDVARKEDSEEEKQEAVLCDVKCFRADPVCGEDAITYWCGAAEAKCAGVEVAYTGYCDSRSGGAGKDSTRAAQSLFLVHFIWLVLAGFLVIADLL